MTRCLIILAAVCVFLTPAAYATYGYDQWADELGIDVDASYSATRVMETKHGNMEFKEHKAPKKMYMEFEREGVRGAIITREDLDKAYVLMFPMSMYRETSISEASKQAQAGGGSVVTNITRVGNETVNGFDATKYKADYKDSNGSGEGFIWVADGIPVRMDMTYSNGRDRGEKMLMYLKDLQVGSQKESIFEVPGDMKPMNFGNLLGGALGGGNGQQSQQPRDEAPTEAESEEAAKGIRNALKGLRDRFRRDQ